MTGNGQAETNEGQGPQLSYMPGLDGLRAVAVLAVLLYHANYTLLPGGLLGVDVFFVISGYLITSLLLKEWQKRGTINLPAFWLRRARRLLPAVFLLIASVLTFCVIFLPDEVASLRGDAIAASVYMTNWYFIVSQKSYFETIGRPSMFQHLWSLAIEEQFYIIWPIVLLTMLKHWKPRRILFAVLIGIVVSTVLMAVLYVPYRDPSRVYYGTDTRAAGLLIGAALAFVWVPGHLPGRTNKLPLDLIGLAALGLLFMFFWRTNQFEPALYRGGYALVSLTTAVVIAIAVHPAARLGSVLGKQPLRWIGQRSYGIYLWHWPVFMLTRPQLDVAIDGLPLLVLRFGLTFILAEMSYRFVETPIRQGSLGRSWQRLKQTSGRERWQIGLRWGAATIALMLFSLVLGTAVVNAQPPPPPGYLSDEVVAAANSTSTPTSAPTSTPMPTPVSTPTSLPVEPTQAAAPATDTGPEQPSATPISLPVEPTQAATPATDTGPEQPSATPTETPEPAPVAASAAADLTPERAFARRILPAAQPTLPPTVTPAPTTPKPSPVTEAPTSAPQPPATPTPAPTCVATGGVVTAIGDSVMIGAAGELRNDICNIDIDALLGRQVWQAAELMRAKRAAGQIGAVVILHLGDNGIFTASMFDDIMGMLSGARRVVFLTVKVPREYESPNNAVIRDGVKRYKNTVLVDWHTASTTRPDIFWSDGMHLRPEGAKLYAELVTAAVKGP